MTAEELLSLLDFDTTSTPAMPFANMPPVDTPEELHFLWLPSFLLGDFPVEDDEEEEEAPEPTPGPESDDIVIPVQRWLVRTAQFDQLGPSAIEDFQISIKRGIGDNSDAPRIRFRVNRDNKGFGKWIVRSLGLAGDRYSTIRIGPLGTAHVWQFEVSCDDECDIELQGMEAIFKRIGR